MEKYDMKPIEELMDKCITDLNAMIQNSPIPHYIEEEEEVLSECCSAKIIHTDLCSECKEHI